MTENRWQAPSIRSAGPGTLARETDLLAQMLPALEDSDMLAPSVEGAGEYAFKHALLQEVVYASLLKHDRQRLHRAVAHALEQIYAGRLEEFAWLLARHYCEAGDPLREIRYGTQAGQVAARLYANAEAIEHFTRVIERAKHHARKSLPPLYRARGQIYERLGDFLSAYGDYEQALTLARAAHDGPTHWQCLIELGLLFASRSYFRTGMYFHQALELAEQLGNRTLIAHSLNRVGNWHINVENAQAALEHHQQALAIFQELNHRQGLAETYDLLGIANVMGGDVIKGAYYYDRAIELFTALQDRGGLVSSQSAYSLLHPNYDSQVAVAERTYADTLPIVETSLESAQEMGWRAGEAFAQGRLAISYGSTGQYARALELARAALNAALSIQHQQWTVNAHYALGCVLLDLLDADNAQLHLERALKMADRMRSGYWTRVTTGWLAHAFILQGNQERAQELLDLTLAPGVPMETLAQRRLWFVSAMLALYQHQPAQALDIVERLIVSAKNRTETTVIPLLWYLRGRTLTRLGRFESAEHALADALDAAHAQNLRMLIWRIHMVRAGMYRAGEHPVQAAAALADARSSIAELAQEVPAEFVDPFLRRKLPLRQTFLDRAEARLQAVTSKPSEPFSDGFEK